MQLRVRSTADGKALQAVSLAGLGKTVQVLLNKGADVSAQGGGYGNALQAASIEGHEKVVQMLLDNFRERLRLRLDYLQISPRLHKTRKLRRLCSIWRRWTTRSA
jgi:hypothetical protein